MIRRRGWMASGLAVAIFLAVQVTSTLAVDPAATALPAAPGVEAEPNDTSGTASPIASGERIRAPLFPNGDIDYYRFAAQAGDRVFAAVMTSGSAGSSTDSQLTVLASDGSTVLEFDEDNGFFAGFSSSIAGTLIPSDGTYFLRIKDFTAGTASERPYDLYFQLRPGAPATEVEPNDTPPTATSLASGFVSGARNPSTDVDFYSVQLQAGDTVFLSLDLDPERDGTTLNGRLGLGLMGDVDNQILVVNDAGATETPNPTHPSEAFFMTVGKAGTYYAFVDGGVGEGGSAATYQLSSTILPAEQSSCRTYPALLTGPIPDGGGFGFPILVDDAFRIDRAAIRFNLRHALMADLDVSIEAPNDDSEVALFTDIGASSTGSQTHMETIFDQDAAISSAYSVLRPLMLQPEEEYRLSWLEGRQAAGNWILSVRDDNPNGNSGTLSSAALMLCEQIDDPVRKQIFEADFESGENGFTHTGTQDEWEHGLPATVATASSEPVAGLSTCAQGAACFKTDLDNTYNASSSQDLISPPISLAGISGPIIVSWEQWHQMETANFDHASVSVDEDGGGNARTLFTWLDGTMKSTLGNVVINPNHPAAAGWGRHRADISEYAGKTIRLRFHLDSDSLGNYAGLAIDDVRVYQQGTPTPTPPTTNPEPGPSASLGPQRPTVSGLTIKPKRFRVAGSGPSATGTSISYTDSLEATATLTVFRTVPGRKVGGKCKPLTKSNSGRPRCARSLKVGSFTHVDTAGLNQFRFSGRIGGRKLKPGDYRLEVVASQPGGESSQPVAATFRIVP